MVKITSKEAQNNFGRLIDDAQVEPITITRRSRDTVVVVSSKRYKELEALEDAIWAASAREAANSGFVGEEESAAFIREILNA